MGAEGGRMKGDEDRKEGKDQGKVKILLGPVEERGGKSLEPGNGDFSVEGRERGRGKEERSEEREERRNDVGGEGFLEEFQLRQLLQGHCMDHTEDSSTYSNKRYEADDPSPAPSLENFLPPLLHDDRSDAPPDLTTDQVLSHHQPIERLDERRSSSIVQVRGRREGRMEGKESESLRERVKSVR
jgi:hypothetical protein